MEGARRSYQNDIDKFNTSVVELVEKKIEAARKGGNKTLVDGLEAELEQFQGDGILPSTSPAKHDRQRAALRARLERAYESAIKKCTRAGEDSLAENLEQEATDFRHELALKAARRKILGTWKLRLGNYMTDLVFKADGAVINTKEIRTAKWTIDVAAGFVFVEYSPVYIDKISLPLNFKGTQGVTGNGRKFVIAK